MVGLTHHRNFRDLYYEQKELFAMQDLSHFSNLVELEVYKIYGDLNDARKGLVKVLLNSPNLRTLGLSISDDTMERLDGREHWLSNGSI